MNAYLPVGTRVIFNELDVLRHLHHEQEEVKGVKRWVKRWKRNREAYPFLKDEGPQAGVIVGVRTKRSGYTRGDWEDGREFVTVESHRVYMVAVDLFKNPVYLFVEDVTLEGPVLP